jgi:4-hydroxybenzoate polyprenyltransferase
MTKLTSRGGSRRVRQLTGFARASHLGPTLVVSSATTALALSAGRGWSSAWVYFAVLAGQCCVGWSNDAFDAVRDRQVNRVRKPTVAGLVAPLSLRRASTGAFVFCVALSFASGWRAALVHIVAVLAAIGYNAGIKATFLSAVPYAISFALLPAFVTLGLASHLWPQPIVMLAAALVGVGAHFINAVKDIEADRLTSVRGLPQRLGFRLGLEVGALSLLVAGVLIASRSPHREIAVTLAGLAGVVDVSVVIAGAKQRSSMAWNLALLAAVLCLGVFVLGGGTLVRAR